MRPQHTRDLVDQTFGSAQRLEHADADDQIEARWSKGKLVAVRRHVAPQAFPIRRRRALEARECVVHANHVVAEPREVPDVRPRPASSSSTRLPFSSGSSPTRAPKTFSRRARPSADHPETAWSSWWHRPNRSNRARHSASNRGSISSTADPAILALPPNILVCLISSGLVEGAAAGFRSTNMRCHCSNTMRAHSRAAWSRACR